MTYRAPANREPGMVPLLAAVLADLPRLDGAACTGRAVLFDPVDPDEDPDTAQYRLAAAERICRTCPALDACRAWVDALPKRQRPAGTIAGRRTKIPARPGRPRKEIA